MLLIGACGKDRRTNENPAGSAAPNAVKEVQPIISMLDYFPEDGSKGHFKGEGNTLADYDIQVTHAHENYVVVYEKSKDTHLRHIYKIEADRIDMLDSKVIGTDDVFPTLAELNAMQPVSVYLQKPLTEGTVFGDWTIVQTDATVETPYQQFEQAIVIENKDKDVVLRKYFVSGYGEVKRESVMKNEDGSISGTSSMLATLGK